MPYNIKELMNLPAEEKIAIADLLYSSANKQFENEESGKSWQEDEAFVKALTKEFEDLQSGKTKGYTIEEVKNFMKEEKAKYRSK